MAYKDIADDALGQNKLLLSHEILKSVARFFTENSSDVSGVDIEVSTSEPTMTMTSDGKFHTGRTVLCTVNTWSDEDGDDYGDE